MPLPLQICFRNMEPSELLEREIRERAEKLERFADRIIGCRVTVEARHRSQQKGNLFHARIDLDFPGNDIIVDREGNLDHSFEDVRLAIRDAFDAARRQCEDRVRLGRERRARFHHASPPRGRVVRLDYGKDCGFIETLDGREIYFHRNSLVNADFVELQAGDTVRFHEEMGDKGPQASSVNVER